MNAQFMALAVSNAINVDDRQEVKASLFEFSNFQIFTLVSLVVVGFSTVVILSHIRQKLEVESVSRKYTRELENAFTAGGSSREAFIASVRQQQGKKLDPHAAYITSLISKNIQEQSTFARELAQTIVKVSRDNNFDPLLVTAVIKAESTFKHGSLSNRGAMGLMQVKPETGAYISEVVDTLKWRGASQLNNPSYNVQVGVSYLKFLMDKFDNNIERALMAYNWGPGNLVKALKGEVSVPESARAYAKNILGNQSRWKGELKLRNASLLKGNKSLA